MSGSKLRSGSWRRVSWNIGTKICCKSLVAKQCLRAMGEDRAGTLLGRNRAQVYAKQLKKCRGKPPSYLRLHTYTATVCFSNWQRLPGLIHGTHPISHSACATHVFLFNLLVFSSSATTRMLPAIFFPAQYKRITDVKGWNMRSPSPRPVL